MSEKKISFLKNALKKGEAALGRLAEEEAKSRAKWTARYRRFIDASNALVDLTIHGTKRESVLKNVIRNWKEETEKLTQERDEKRAAMKKKEAELQSQRLEIAVLEERLRNDNQHRDEIVGQVFALNDAVVRALADRNSFLTEQVYPQLIDEKGRLRSQITFTSTDGLRRVVALVNHLTKMDTALAAEAKMELDTFFRRFAQEMEKDEATLALIEILEKVLTERVHFKVGPDLYRFLGLDLENTAFPELKKAQMLLRQAMRSEKTNSYVRLFRRASTRDKWVEVKLT